MADNVRLVATAIAALSMTDAKGKAIKVLDLDGMRIGINAQDCPVLSPDPDELTFFTNLQIERESMGTGTTAKFNMQYDLSYVLFYRPAAAGLTLMSEYANLVTTALTVLRKLITLDAPNGAIDMLPVGVPRFGAVRDMTGAVFHGAVYTLRCLEFVNG